MGETTMTWADRAFQAVTADKVLALLPPEGWRTTGKTVRCWFGGLELSVTAHSKAAWYAKAGIASSALVAPADAVAWLSRCVSSLFAACRAADPEQVRVIREYDALRTELAAAKANATQHWKAGRDASAAKVKDSARAWKDTDPNLSDALTRTALGILSLTPPEVSNG